MSLVGPSLKDPKWKKLWKEIFHIIECAIGCVRFEDGHKYVHHMQAL